MEFEGKDIKVYIGEVIRESQKKSFEAAMDDWDEEMGPTPMPGVTDLRHWDEKLLKRYKPKYHAFIKQCQFCAFGPCDLDKGRRGACGITLERQMARESLFLAITGCAAHAAHGRHQVHTLIHKFGGDTTLNVAENTEVEAPNIRLVCGYKPKTLGDLEKAIGYVEEQLTHLLSSLHMGQEASDFDFNSKALHAGMLDHVGMEVCDISQISALNFPKGDPEPELCEIGFGSIDKSKPVILCIGHNVAAGAEVIDYAAENNIDVEACAICCTALDLGRYHTGAKVVGQLSYQLQFVRAGIADLIMVDEQCIRVDTLENAKKLGIPLIAVSDKNAAGLPDLSNENPDEVVSKLVFGEITGCYMPDLEKAGEIAVKTALLVKKRKGKEGRANNYEGASKKTADCIGCGLCSRACPVGVDNKLIVQSIDHIFNKKGMVKGKKVKDVSADDCIGCGICSRNCPNNLEIKDLIFGIKNKQEIKGKLLAALKGCSECGLCQEKCPRNVDIKNVVKAKKRELNIKTEIKYLTKEEILERLEQCLFCGRCESWCPQNIPIVSAFTEVYMNRFKDDKAKISPGRGAVQDVEIREVGMPIVFGEIPGIIAPVGCSLWPRGGAELGEIIEEFLKRNYIVATSGCSAMALATDYSGTHNLYEKYGGRFAAGNLVNVGSCVANSHITGAAIKVANIFAKRKLRANYEEIADYCLNRIGAVGLVLGTMSQKAVSIGFGCMRLGVPVIWGPQGIKYRKELLGDVDIDYSDDDHNDIFNYDKKNSLDRWEVYDSFSGERFDVGPVPEHLSYAAKTKEEIMIMIPKLCIRASDNFKGRQIKIAHWVDMYQRYSGEGKNALPPDIHKFVRAETDIPVTMKDNVLEFIKNKGWKPQKKQPDPTLVERLVRKKKNN